MPGSRSIYQIDPSSCFLHPIYNHSNQTNWLLWYLCYSLCLTSMFLVISILKMDITYFCKKSNNNKKASISLPLIKSWIGHSKEYGLINIQIDLGIDYSSVVKQPVALQVQVFPPGYFHRLGEIISTLKDCSLYKWCNLYEIISFGNLDDC